MQQVGKGAVFDRDSVDPGILTFAEGHFIAFVANSSEGTIASFATGTVNQTFDGYTLQCSDAIDGIAVGDAKISIPGKHQLQTNAL